MNYSHTAQFSLNPRHVLALVMGLLLTALVGSFADAQIDGFTEPFRTIELSSDETGAIATLNVEEGDTVSEGETVACLDTRVQELQLEIATQTAKNTSQVDAAEATYTKREVVSRRLRELVDKGHARESELMRSELELSIAAAKLLSTREDKVVQEIEVRRAQVMLDRRCVKAPFDGVIAKILRQEGEFLSPVGPEIATLVQVDRLLATFMIPSSQAHQFQPGNAYKVELENGQVVEAEVYRVGVLTDAQSGTVEVKLVIENPHLEFRSGEICTLQI